LFKSYFLNQKAGKSVGSRYFFNFGQTNFDWPKLLGPASKVAFVKVGDGRLQM